MGNTTPAEEGHVGGEAASTVHMATPGKRPVNAAKRLRRFVALHKQGLISDDEYTAKCAEIIDEL